MLKGVLHDGLQDERRHHRLGQLEGIRDLPLHPHPVAEADVVDGVILVHNPHFPGERHLLVVAHQAVPQQVRQCGDECLRPVGFLLPGRLQNDVQGIEEEMRVDLAAELLQPAPLHPVLQLQCLRFLSVQLPLDLVFLPQGVHLFGHRVLHVVERLGQLPHLILMGHRNVRGIKRPPCNGLRRTDQLLHRGQQPQHRQRHHAAQQQAEPDHHRLDPFDPVAQLRHPGVGLLRIGNGRVEQLLGVLTEIISAGSHLIVIELRRLRVAAGLDGRFQLLDQSRVAVKGGADRTVEQVLLLADRIQIAVDPPEPCVHGGKRPVQLLQQFVRIAVFPPVRIQRVQTLLHTVLKPADGVEVAHLVVQLPKHGIGLVEAQVDLRKQCQKECRQTEHHPLLQGHVPPHRIAPPLFQTPCKTRISLQIVLFYHVLWHLRKFFLDCLV